MLVARVQNWGRLASVSIMVAHRVCRVIVYLPSGPWLLHVRPIQFSDSVAEAEVERRRERVVPLADGRNGENRLRVVMSLKTREISGTLRLSGPGSALCVCHPQVADHQDTEACATRGRLRA